MGTTIPAGYVETKKGIYVRRDLIKKGEVGRKTIPAGYVEVREGVYERRDVIKQKASVAPKRKAPPPLTQPPLLHEPLSEVEGKEGDSSRLLVLIESVRGKLLDTDNLYGGAKFYCDFLRFCGCLKEDTEAEIELKVTQRKKKKGEEEKTIIEVWDRRL